MFIFADTHLLKYKDYWNWGEKGLLFNINVPWDAELIEILKEKYIPWQGEIVALFENRILVDDNDNQIQTIDFYISQCSELFYHSPYENAYYTGINAAWQTISCSKEVPFYIQLLSEEFDDADLSFFDLLKLIGSFPRENIEWSIEIIEKYKGYWDWALLSENEYLPWTINLIEKFENLWNWENLYFNQSIPWSKEIIEKYFKKFDWSYWEINKTLIKLDWDFDLFLKFKEIIHDYYKHRYRLVQNNHLFDYIIADIYGKHFKNIVNKEIITELIDLMDEE